MKTSNKILLGGVATIAVFALINLLYIKANTVIKVNGEVVNSYEDWDKDIDVRNATYNNFNSFTGIDSDVPAKMLIRKGAHKVIISVEAQNEGKIMLEEKETMLKIRQKEGTSITDRVLKIQVTTPDLHTLILNGSGYTQTDLEGFQQFNLDTLVLSTNGSGGTKLDMNVENLEILIQGSGSVEVNGKGDYVNAEIQGSGSIRCERFIADHVNVRNNGSGYVKVVANQSLNAQVNGSGSLRYKGNATDVNTRVNGSGSIHKD